MKTAELLVKCLENEGVTLVFGLPGEENLDVMDALVDSSIQFITVRHEQGAAFMADVYGRLTGKAGVCLSTLGPGATNLVTGVADAHLDHAPLVAIAGQGSTLKLHKESHQVLDLVNLFRPISKYAVSVREPETLPEIIRKAFKVSQTEKPGVSFIEFPENIAEMKIEKAFPLPVQSPVLSHPSEAIIIEAAQIISEAKFPLVMAGNGLIRTQASEKLIRFSEKLNIPVAHTFMAKGALPFSSPRCLGTVGLQARDHIACGFDKADVIICVGYDMVEYPPHFWHPTKDRKIIHIDTTPADVDNYYIPQVEVIGDIGFALDEIAKKSQPQCQDWFSPLRQNIVHDVEMGANDENFPLNPQRITWDLHQVLNPDDIVICDVGAHKIWMARLYPVEKPNTCIISNGFASMGIALPGAIAAKKITPERNVVAVMGDGGFLMNSQEIETALRIGVAIVILIWHDNTYGLIKWKQDIKFGRSSHVDFKNPDFVQYAQSFGAKGYRVNRAQDLKPILLQAFKDNTVVVIDCPVNYQANLQLTAQLGEFVCPV